MERKRLESTTRFVLFCQAISHGSIGQISSVWNQYSLALQYVWNVIPEVKMPLELPKSPLVVWGPCYKPILNKNPSR